MGPGGRALVGREVERAATLRALKGEPGNVVLHGPAGIGKTRLPRRWPRPPTSTDAPSPSTLA